MPKHRSYASLLASCQDHGLCERLLSSSLHIPAALQVDTPGRTLGFWHKLKIHPNRPDWILAKVRRSVCEEWDASTNPWCAYDLFVSQVRLLYVHSDRPESYLLRDFPETWSLRW